MERVGSLSRVRPPRVSVVIPVYNRERFVGAAIESVLRQSFDDLELVVVDDASTDSSYHVVKEYRDPRIRAVRHEFNQGIARARNHGVALSRGEYVAMLDSDDVALPERFAAQVRYLDRHPDCAALGSWAGEINADGSRTGKVKRRPSDPEALRLWMLFRCCLLQTTLTARRSVLCRYPYRDHLKVFDDHDLVLRISADHPVANLPRPLVLHREHGRQITRERAALAEREKFELVRGALARLGVDADDDDLARHFDLAHLRSWGLRPNGAFLTWAEGWLNQLVYSLRPDARDGGRGVARAASAVWLRACWRARDLGALRRFRRSRLRRGAFRETLRGLETRHRSAARL